MSVVRAAIRRPIATWMLFGGIALFGLVSLTRLPVDLLPHVAHPTLTVFVSYPKAPPIEVERLVTVPVERAASVVAGVESVESTVREGVSVTTVSFPWGTDMGVAAMNLREKLDNARANLPDGALRPVVLSADPNAAPVVALTVWGHASPEELGRFATTTAKQRLEQTHGVAGVDVAGEALREIHVQVDPTSMSAYGLTLDDVTRGIADENTSASVGTVLQSGFRYSVRLAGDLRSLDDIRGVQINRVRPSASPTPVRVADVAQVSEETAERQSVTRLNGQDAVTLLVYKAPGANTIAVSGAVRATVQELAKTYPSLQFAVAADDAQFIDAAIGNVVQEILVGGVLAFAVLFAFLRDVRYPLAIGVVIPISLLATFLAFDALGVTLNLMTLGGLALGVSLLMDNSIVVVESIFCYRAEGYSPAEAAARGTADVQLPIVTSTATTIAVFGPVLYVRGVSGQLFGALALAVSLALACSVVVALYLVPAISARWTLESNSEGARASDNARHRGVVRWFAAAHQKGFNVFDRAWERFASAYESALEWALAHRALVLASTGVAIVGAVGFGITLPRRLLPAIDAESFTVRLELPRGTALQSTDSVASRLSRVLRADSSVSSVLSLSGRSDATEADLTQSGPNTALLKVQLTPGQSAAQTEARVLTALRYATRGAVTLDEGGATFASLLGRGRTDVVLHLYGTDPDATRAYAARLASWLDHDRRVSNVQLGGDGATPETRINIDRDRASAYAVSIGDIAHALQGAASGSIATQYTGDGEEVPIRVGYSRRAEESLDSIGEIRVRGVPLAMLTRHAGALGPTTVQRVGQERVVDLGVDVGGAGLSGALDAVSSALKRLPPPPGIRAETAGENNEVRRSLHDLQVAFGVALLLCYMLLAAEFESFYQPLIVLVSVPLGLLGGIGALWVTGSELTAISGIGLIVLVGIVDNDAVVKIAAINEFRRRGLAVADAIRAAGHARLRPIVINTVTALFGLVPMILGIGPGATLQAPFAIAIFGGLATATALTLIVLPVLYSALEDCRDCIRVWIGARNSATSTPTLAQLAAVCRDETTLSKAPTAA